MAVLVKFIKDWCDEFDVKHFYARKGVSASEEMEKVAIQIASGEAGFWFGTNEGWEDEEMDIDDYEFIDITENSSEIQAAIEEISGYNYFQDIKWYEWKDDVKTVSLQFPDQVIKIYGEGEEAEDMWKAYIKNGKSFITEAKITFEDFDESKLQ